MFDNHNYKDDDGPIASLMRLAWATWFLAVVFLVPIILWQRRANGTKQMSVATTEQETKFWIVHRWTSAMMLYGVIMLYCWFARVLFFGPSDHHLVFYLSAATNVFGTLHAIFMDRTILTEMETLTLVQTNFLYVIGLSMFGVVWCKFYGTVTSRGEWLPPAAERAREQVEHDRLEKPFHEITKKMIAHEDAKPSFADGFEDLPQEEQQRQLEQWQTEFDAIKRERSAMPRYVSKWARR